MKEQTAEHKGFLTGKKVIILGGSAGIGLATAMAASQEGAEVVIVSSNQQRIDKALEQLPKGNQGFAVNLTDEQQVQQLFAQIGPFDHLVYTAGENLVIKALQDLSIDEAKGFFELRYWGAVTAVKYAAPHIKAGGSIVLTGGAASVRPGKGWSLGASICAGMEGFTRAMAVELAPLRVNLVAPGVVKTDLWSDMAEADRNAMYEQIGNNLPVKFAAEAADIATTYIYLMRQQYSTGQVIITDGGYVLV